MLFIAINSPENPHFIFVEGFLFNKKGEIIYNPTISEEIKDDDIIYDL